MKMVVFFRADDDPEIYDLITDSFVLKVRKLKVDDVLTFVVNYAHTLHPGAQLIFDTASQEI
jgi:hypothetical protein